MLSLNEFAILFGFVFVCGPTLSSIPPPLYASRVSQGLLSWRMATANGNQQNPRLMYTLQRVELDGVETAVWRTPGGSGVRRVTPVVIGLGLGPMRERRFCVKD